MGLPPEETDGDANVDDFVAKQREMADAAYRVARERLQAAAERRKVTYDARVKKNAYQVGEQVWYYYPRRYTRKSPKWQRCYTGPYWVVRSIPPVNYVIQRTPKSKPFVVHMDKLKKCFSHQTDSGGRPILDSRGDAPPTPTSSSDGQVEESSEVSRGYGGLHTRPIQLPRRYRD